MKIIPSKVHGYIDYTLAAILWFAPTIFAFENVGGPAVWVPRAIALLILGQSLLTNYELGVFKVIPLSVHLILDLAASAFLAASPFVFGFSTFDANVWMPHVVAGVGYFIISFLTESRAHQVARAHA